MRVDRHYMGGEQMELPQRDKGHDAVNLLANKKCPTSLCLPRTQLFGWEHSMDAARLHSQSAKRQ